MMTDDQGPIDLSARRSARPRLREVHLIREGKPTQHYTLTIAPGERFSDYDQAEVVPRLLAAGIAVDGQPLARMMFDLMPFATLAAMVKFIDLEIYRQDSVPPGGTTEICQDGGYLNVDLYLAGQWRGLIMRPWGDALRLASDDAVALRHIFNQIELAIDGQRFDMERLCALSDVEVIALSYALLQASMETVRIHEERRNGN